MKTLILPAISVLMVALTMGGCASHEKGPSNRGNDPALPQDGPVVEMETTAGVITLELDGRRAPVSTANFLEHAGKGHYDGTIFHRVIANFVVQGGGWTIDMKEKGKADAAAGHPDVPIKNEWQNGLKNVKFSIAMAREADPDTATREFYINVNDNVKLDGPRPTTGNAGYAVFGRVIKGFDVVETIRTGATGPRKDVSVDDGSMENVPLKPVTALRVRRVK